MIREIIFQFAATTLFVQSVMSCAPGNAPPACVTRNLLPSVAPAGAMECGDYQLGQIDNVPSLAGEESLRCANAALVRQAPFILRHRLPIPGRCDGNGMCFLTFGTAAAYVGGSVNGVFVITEYRDGGTVAEGLHARKHFCEPAPGATLIWSPAPNAVRIDCAPEGGVSRKLDELPYDNACTRQ